MIISIVKVERWDHNKPTMYKHHLKATHNVESYNIVLMKEWQNINNIGLVALISTTLVQVQALLDTGANSCFMDRDVAQAHQIPLHKLPCPVSVIVIDGRLIASGKIFEESEPIHTLLGDLGCIVFFNIIRSPEHRIVLGLPWFELHNPIIDWRSREI